MIKLFAMDVDGTLTDGGIILHGSGGESKRFDVQDGLGIVRLQAAGVEVAFVSGRRSPATLRRAEDLGVRVCRQGVKDKLAALQDLAKDRGLRPSEVAFVGDDLNDVACLRWAGWGGGGGQRDPRSKGGRRHGDPSFGGGGGGAGGGGVLAQTPHGGGLIHGDLLGKNSRSLRTGRDGSTLLLWHDGLCGALRGGGVAL